MEGSFIEIYHKQITGQKIIITFVMLLGVLGTCGPAEIIPYEPDMYNDSAGKRYYFSIIICIHRRIPL